MLLTNLDLQTQKPRVAGFWGVTHESTMWGPTCDGLWAAANERVAQEHRLSREQWADPMSVHVPAYLPDTTEVRHDIARFYNAVAIKDQQIGEMLAALDASPHRENTIVIYLTDHGRGLWREKRFHYIRNFYPQLPYAQRSSYMERMATVRVIRELHAQGRLTAEQSPFMASRRPTEELYDSKADPDRVRNLADDPIHTDTLMRLRLRLEQFLEQVPDLGVRSERQLIDEGIVADNLDDYAAAAEPLPGRYALGERCTPILEMPDE